MNPLGESFPNCQCQVRDDVQLDGSDLREHPEARGILWDIPCGTALHQRSVPELSLLGGWILHVRGPSSTPEILKISEDFRFASVPVG